MEFASEPADRLVSDFEGGSLDVATVAGRTGRWILGSDGSSGALIAEASQKCAARDKWAGHFAARGFTNWGSNWTAIFTAPADNGTALPYDARAYNAVSFWAAFGGDNDADFAVQLGISTMDTAWNGGICKSCMDFYVDPTPLTHEWRRYVVPFSAMAQVGWGNPLVAMRRDQMVGFILWPKQQFDIWIDDIRLEP